MVFRRNKEMVVEFWSEVGFESVQWLCYSLVKEEKDDATVMGGKSEASLAEASIGCCTSLREEIPNPYVDHLLLTAIMTKLLA